MNEKKFAVIGYPIAHTMSPFIHSHLFSLCGVPARYGVLEISPGELAARIPELRLLDGFNITIPHKRAIIPFLDALDQKAEAFGSVNTVKNENGRLTGYTTDGEGFVLALRAAGVKPDGRTAILGAGGAARAIAFECALAGGGITLATRAHGVPAAECLAADLHSLVPGAHIGHCLISELSGPFDLLVNATPAGMYPDVAACPVGPGIIRLAACVFDAVYNPGETELLRQARASGIPAVGGMGMLVRQAAAAEKIWLGSDFAEQGLQVLCRDASFEMKKKFGNIVLCGFMGSGKTTVGSLLAEKLDRRFVDMDAWIEEREKAPVSKIFSQKGEAYFRECERKASRELSRQCSLVVATGGGTLLNPENAGAFRENGVVILLDAGLDVIRRRLAGDTSRPLLRRADREAEMQRLYRERIGAYRAASDIAVPADGSSGDTAKAVAEAVGLGLQGLPRR